MGTLKCFHLLIWSSKEKAIQLHKVIVRFIICGTVWHLGSDDSLVGGWFMHSRTFSSIPGLYPLDGSITLPSPPPPIPPTPILEINVSPDHLLSTNILKTRVLE